MHNSHPRDFVGYGANPPQPKWPGNARLALNFVINYEEGSEPSVPDGDDASETGLTEGGAGGFTGRDLAAESMFEYGSRVGIWRIARLLEQHNFPATLFACALALERNPEVCQLVRKNNWDICAHGWRWERHQNLSVETERERIAQAYTLIEHLTGKRASGWYCRYGPSLNTRQLLAQHGGFMYDSDAYNDELPYYVPVDGKAHLVLPYGLVNNDAKFIRGGMTTGDDFYQCLRDAFDILYDEGSTQPKMMSVGLHLRLAGHPGRAAGLKRFLSYVASHNDVWVCRREDIARHWRQTYPTA